jgi:hypothetical protein
MVSFNKKPFAWSRWRKEMVEHSSLISNLFEDGLSKLKGAK